MTPADKKPETVALDEKGLLPCPFCACEATAYVRLGEIYRDVIVTCSGCEAEIGSTDAWTERASDEQGLAKTIAAWNRRAIPANPALVTDAAVKAASDAICATVIRYEDETLSFRELMESAFGEDADYAAKAAAIVAPAIARIALTAAIGAGGQAVELPADAVPLSGLTWKGDPSNWMNFWRKRDGEWVSFEGRVHPNGEIEYRNGKRSRHNTATHISPISQPHPAPSGQAVAVKALEWSDEAKRLARQLKARAAGTSLRTYTDRMAEDDAKAAEILSALAHPVQPAAEGQAGETNASKGGLSE